MQSREHADVYTTDEPHQAFHKRTQYCLDVHNAAVKSMRFPPDAHSRKMAEAEEEERRQREQELLESGDLDEEPDDDMM